MLFLEKGIYAVAAILIVFFGAFEPDTAEGVLVENASARSQFAYSSVAEH